MKRILFVILVLAMAASVSAVPLVRNNSASPTAEDSLTFIFHLPDTVAQPHSHLDTTHILVWGPGGDSIAAKVLVGTADSANFGKITKRRTGILMFDTCYAFTFQVSNLDGTGRAGVYSMQVLTVSHNADSSRWLRFAKDYQFQIVPALPSAWAGAASLDSATAEHAAYAGAMRFALDSTVRSDTLITKLLDSLVARGVNALGTAWWDSIQILLSAGSWEATASSHNTSGTMGYLLNFAGNPTNYPTLTEAAVAMWESTAVKNIDATQAFSNTGTWTGNITGSLSGSVGSVTGAVGSVTGGVGGDVGGDVVGSVGGVATSVAEQIADVTQDSVGGARGGASSTSLNEILNPYFNINDTVTFVGTTSTTAIGTIAGWYGTIYSTGTGTDNSVAVEYNDLYSAESTVTGGRRVEFTVQRTHTSGQQDSIVLYSNEIKLFPGIYKYGVRGRSSTSITQFDAGVIDLYNVAAGAIVASFNMVQPYSNPSSVGTWPIEASQYVASDTQTVRLRIRLYESRLSGNPPKIYQMSSAFVTAMGYNTWAMPAATARAIAGSVGDSLQKPIQVAVDVDEGSIVDSIFNELVASHLTAGSFGALAYRIDSVARAIKDTLSDGVNGPLVNVQALGNDSSAANAMSYVFDTTDAGKAKLTLQELWVGPPQTLHNALTVVGTSTSAVSIYQSVSNNAAAVSITGGGKAIQLEGGSTASPGLGVAGSGGSNDVEGVFFDSGAISIGDINLTLSGSGDNLVNIRTRDTSGTDNWVMDVDITIRPVGSSTTEAFLRTNDSGLAHFTLPVGTYQVLLRRPGYQFLPDTITVTGNAALTIDGYNLSNANVATVYGCLRDLGMTTGRAYVGISMPEKRRNNCDSTLLLTNVIKEQLTDSLGCFTFDNVPWSSCFGEASYKVTIKAAATTGLNIFNPATATREYKVTVPDSVSYRVIF